MKPTLADYLLRERAEIFKHQETMEKLSSLFGELKGIFEAIDIEKSNIEEEDDEDRKEVISTQKANAKTPKVEDTLAAAAAATARSRRPSQCTEAAAGDNQSSAPVFTSFLSRAYPQPPPQPEVTASNDELLSPTTHNYNRPAGDVVLTNRRDLIDGGHHSQQQQQFLSTTTVANSSTIYHRRPTVTWQGPPVNRAKTDAYRRELLQQIEEKKQAKQAEADRQRAADGELEKRINEDRLKMYLQYLEERQKGEGFIGARSNKTTAAGAVDTILSSAPGTSVEGATTQHQPNQHQQLQHSSTDFSRLKVPAAAASAAPQPDRNILSNLGEVRKIMQHDHIEMLQQLLDLHIK